jgi:hypothetical protein
MMNIQKKTGLNNLGVVRPVYVPGERDLEGGTSPSPKVVEVISKLP